MAYFWTDKIAECVVIQIQNWTAVVILWGDDNDIYRGALTLAVDDGGSDSSVRPSFRGYLMG